MNGNYNHLQSDRMSKTTVNSYHKAITSIRLRSRNYTSDVTMKRMTHATPVHE